MKIFPAYIVRLFGRRYTKAQKGAAAPGGREKQMKLSVIIPVHNAAKYLNACLDSVLSQDIQDMEVICIDDASADNSADIIAAYQEKDSRISLIKNSSTMYAGTCRNTGLKEAQGEYVHFLDSDDMVEEGAYLRYYNMAKATDADLVKGRSNCFDNDTHEISTTPLLDLSEVPEDGFGNISTFSRMPEIFSHISVVPWNGIYKTSFLKENKIEFNHLICVNDRSFFNEAVILAGRILLTKERLVKYRINNNQSLMGNRALNFQCQFQSFSIVQEQCRKYNLTGRPLACILERELIDLFIWYRKYKKLPEIQDSIIAQTTEFSHTLDISPLTDYPPAFKWYYDYLLLTKPKFFEDYLKRFEKESDCKKQVKKLMAQSSSLTDFQSQLAGGQASVSVPAASGFLKKALKKCKRLFS